MYHRYVSNPSFLLHKELLDAETILGDWLHIDVSPPLVLRLGIIRRGAKGGIVTCAADAEVVSETEQKLGLDPCVAGLEMCPQ